MYCSHCNSENPEGVKFCENCGTQLDNSYQNYNQPYQQPNYNQAQPYQYSDMPTENEHMTVGGWIGVFCINLIPCVGSLVYLIMMFVWAFGSTPKKSLKTFARAQLIIMAIVLVLTIIVLVILFASGFFVANQFYSYNRSWNW